MKAYTEQIDFRATSSKGSFAGLDYAERKLQALNTLLKSIQGQLSGVSSRSLFKLSGAQFESNIRAMEGFSKGPVGVAKVARLLGFPDVKDVRRAAEQIARETENEVAKLQRRLDRSMTTVGGKQISSLGAKAQQNLRNKIAELRGASYFTDAGARTFLNPTRAGQFLERYSGPALKNILRGEQALNAILSGTNVNFAPGATAAAAGVASGDGGGKKKKSAQSEFRDALAAIRRNMAEQIRGEGDLAGTADPAKLAAARARAASQIRALVSGATGEAVGKGRLTDDALARAATLETQAEDARQRGMITAGKNLAKTRRDLAAARKRGDQAEADRLEQERKDQEARLKALNRAFYTPYARATADRAKRASRVAEFERQQEQTSAFRNGSYLGAQTFVNDLLNRGATRVGGRPAGGKQAARDVYELNDGNQISRYTVTWGKAAAEITQTTKAVKALREQTGWLGSDFLTNTMKVAKWSASVGLLYKSLELARDSAEQFIEISGQYARLDQIFNKVGGSTEQLTSDILHLAAVNGRSADEAMESAISWSRLGMNRIQVNEAVRLSLMAANVTQLSAADTTEHMQAIMQNYGLTVGDLAAKLGEMVRISNIYNVTNADMLQGVSRTAAVAKQAGVPFEELIGLIGATVGATKQSGANIGNAIKTVITSLGNPSLQQKLHLFYGIQTEGPNGQVKNMGAVLDEIYIRYQRLDDLQKRAMLFQIGGKFQSSRLSAMLDNYVKAQVLAIDAQLHLNTAEQENLKITSALKAQLTGLSTEWDRFVQIQGTNGPAQALGQISTALRNVLALMNAPGANMAVSGLLGLSTVAAAKVALTGLSISGEAGKSGWFGQTKAKAIEAALGLNAWANMAVSSFVRGSDMIGPVKPQGPMQRLANSFNQGSSAAMSRNTALNSIALARWNVAGQTAILTAKAWNATIAATSKILAVATAALTEWLVPLALVTGGILLFNKAMDYIEGNAEAARKKLAGFNDELERSAAAANAFGEAAGLFGTAMKAFSPLTGFASLSPQQAQRMIQQLTPATFLNEPDLKKRDALQKQWQQQMSGLAAKNDSNGLLQQFSAQRDSYLGARRDQMQAAFEANRNKVTELQQDLATLDQKDSTWGIWGAGGRAEKRQEYKDQLAEAQGDIVRGVQEELDFDDQILSTDQRVTAEKEKQQKIVEAIASVFSSMPTNNPMEKWYLDRTGALAQLVSLENRKNDLLNQSQGMALNRSQQEQQLSALGPQLDAAREKLKKLKDFQQQYDIRDTDLFPTSPGPMPLIHPMETPADTRKRLQTDIDALEARKESIQSGLPTEGQEQYSNFAIIQKQLADLNQKIVEAKNTVNAINETQQIAQDSMQLDLGGARAKRELAPFDYGINKSDRIWRQYGANQQQINDLMAKPNKTLEDMADLQAKILTQQQLMLDLRQRQAEVEAEIHQTVLDTQREFSKSVLSAGPTDMLRKLAAFRMAFDASGNMRPTSQGQFFSMSPEMRGDFGMLNPTFNPDLINLYRERNTGNAAIGSIFPKAQPNVSIPYAGPNGGPAVVPYDAYQRGYRAYQQSHVGLNFYDFWRRQGQNYMPDNSGTPDQGNATDTAMDRAMSGLTQKWADVADAIAKQVAGDTPTYQAAKGVMDDFTGSVQGASAALEQLTGIISKLQGNGGRTPGRTPAVVQGGGLGGAKGY